MRFSRIFDGEGGYADTGVDSELEDKQAGVPQDEPLQNAGGMQSSPEAPSADPAPGPNSNPSPQGGNAQPPSPPPPAVVSSVPGIAGSDVTGGVQGSFAQAGSGSNFSRRFGSPANWFQAATKPMRGGSNDTANRFGDRTATTRGSSLAGSGEMVQSLAGPSTGEVGGGPNDEEFQRILQAVLAQRFGR